MEQRFKVSFEPKGKEHEANVLITSNDEGYNYIINLFEQELNKSYPVSFTFVGKDHRFVEERSVNNHLLELFNAIKTALRNHPDNPYTFED